MAYDPVTKVYTPEYTPNPDKYINDMIAAGATKAGAASSARYQAQADAYFAPTGAGANIDPTTGGPRTVVAAGPTSEQLAAEEAAKAKALADAKAAADKKAQDEKDLASRRDAFAIIKSTLTTYGFTAAEIAELSTFIEAGLTNAKMGPEQLKLDMRELPTYKARFAGNTTRVAAGFNALSEANYLQQENDAQGKDVYRVRPSPFDLQGGLPSMSNINSQSIQNIQNTNNDAGVYKKIDASRENTPYNKDQHFGFDPYGQDVGLYTEVDKLHDSTEMNKISDNPMDSNWAGITYTQQMIDSGKYVDNYVNKPVLFQPKVAFEPSIKGPFPLPKDEL
jgi:hypothetical protein